MRSLLMLIIISQLINCTHIKNHDSIKGEVTNYGIVRVIDRGQRISSPESISGYSDQAATMEIVETTKIIALKEGVIFGMEWCAEGFKSNEAIFLLAVKHPEVTGFNGKPRTSSISDYPGTPENGEFCNIDAYQLSQPRELVEGLWSLSILYQGKEIVKKEFLIKNR
ncbi:MAG: DUF3859 domain-containing protein [Cellvibrionaceae bacterium]